MATITMTQNYANLNNWPGRLLEGEANSVFTVKTATTAVIKHGAGHDFANYTISFVGTGFTYIGNTVTGGTVSSVVVRNAAGQVVLTFAGLAAGTLASDFAELAFQVLGSTDPDNNIQGRDGKTVWSHLMSQNDIINGTAGNDDRNLIGFDAGNDTYNMLGGDDYVGGGIGNDTYNGGTGWDTLSFDETTYNEGTPATRGVLINLTLATNQIIDPWGGIDKVNSIEEFRGSRFADTFIGNASDNEFGGMGGRDIINGGAGWDTVKYNNDAWHGGKFGIIANLAANVIRDGFGNIDTVTNVERVIGTRYNDSFTGNGLRNEFAGGEGDDTYTGGGQPSTDSGDGDVIDFGWWFGNSAPGAVNLDLALLANDVINDGFGNAETANGIEGAYGTNNADTLKGDGLNNLFWGGDGLDTMAGRGGRDEFVWSRLHQFNDGDVITDFNVALDKLSFNQSNFAGMNVLRLENDLNPATALGTFLFNNATDILYWDANGSGAGQRYAVVTLTGVSALTAINFELY